jgi:hypothetical protein
MAATDIGRPAYTLLIDGDPPYLDNFSRRRFSRLGEAGLYMIKIGDFLTLMGAGMLHCYPQAIRLVDQDGCDVTEDALAAGIDEPFDDDD